MKKYDNYWKAIVLVLFGLAWIHLIFQSREVIYRAVLPTNEYNATLEIDLCYRTFIEQDHCNNLKTPGEHTAKEEFSCDLTDRIGCFTRGFAGKTVSQIVSDFQSCNISDWAQVTSKAATKSGSVELLFFNGFVCARYRFDVPKSEERSQFNVSSTVKTQPFNLYINYWRDYASDGRYKTKSTQLLKRSCWPNEEGTHSCSETGKNIVLEIDLYSIKLLKHPFSTNCVYRTDSHGRPILQDDCFRNCARNGKKQFYFQTYNASEQIKLETQETPQLKEDLDRCADSCHHEDCQSMSIYVSDIHEKELNNKTSSEESSEGQIILNLAQNDYRREAVPLIPTGKLMWMMSAFFAIFFGNGLYGVLMKSGNLQHFYSFTSSESKWRRQKNKRLLAAALTTAALSLSLGFVYEKLCFDFGRQSDMSILLKDLTEQRSVSVSICFDLCKIVKLGTVIGEKMKADCPEGQDNDLVLMQKWTINELNANTWNVSDFKKVAAVRNNARQYPIRQSDFPIQNFFRGSKKCFLIHYGIKNFWPHYPLQRYSRMHINITGRQHAHYYIEDGFGFPKVEAKWTKISVLHGVYTERSRKRDGCVEYAHSYGQTRDELIRHCIIGKSLHEEQTFPAEATLRSEDKYVIKNQSLKFNENPDMFKKWLNDCKTIDYPNPECSFSYTSLSHKDLLQDRDHIIINLTPYTEDRQPFADDNVFIVTNRIFSFLVIFGGLSIREISNGVLSVYFFEFFSQRNFRLKRRLFHLAVFSLFFLNACLLFFFVILHPMLEYSLIHYVTEIEPTAQFRFCTELELDMESNHVRLNSSKDDVKNLNTESLDFAEIFENLVLYDDNERAITNLTLADFKFKENAPEIAPKAKAWIWRANDSRNDLTIQAYQFYLAELKCVSFRIPSNKTKRNLNVRYHRLHNLFSISFSFKNLRENRREKPTKNQFYIFFNNFYSFDFDWDRPFYFGEYDLEFVTVVRRYEDNYHWLKTNPFKELMDLVGYRKLIDNPNTYLENLREDFIKEQDATTDLMPLNPYDDRDLRMRNRLFNFYIQFRKMSGRRNDYDFTRNIDRYAFKNTAYQQKSNASDSASDRITLNINSNLVKYDQISTNRYRYNELFLHLFLLVSLWFRADLYTLPASLREAYPNIRYFTIEFLYHFVSFLIYLFDLWFAFVRFLKFKNE